MRVAIVGCGFVAEYYVQSLPAYPQLQVVTVMDIDPERALAFSRFYRLPPPRETLAAILEDDSIDMVLNLTNPDSHYAVTKACLEANKHVFSEKPVAMQFEQAQELFQLAEARGLQLGCAPGSILSETAQGLWRALRAKHVGDVRLVYAEIDDGLTHKMPYRRWLSAMGRPWPYRDEFEVGCTLEHAGYYVNWLTAFFGPAHRVNAFAHAVYPHQGLADPLDRISPDFSVACIEFESGVVARLTCSIVARVSQKLQFFGDRGILSIDDAWDYRTPVRVERYLNIRRKMLVVPARRYPLPHSPHRRMRGTHPIEFSRAPAYLATAIERQQPSPLPGDYTLHNNEIVLAIQAATEGGRTVNLQTRFTPIAPLAWADDTTR